jgi:hypothetical protein
VALLFVAVLMSAASVSADRTDPHGGTGGGPIAGSLSVRVILDGTYEPVAGAFVMAGTSPGAPFVGNYGFTDGTGAITFADPDLQGPIDVTAGAAGCRYFTLIRVDANDLVLALRPIAASGTQYQVGDYVSGIDVDNGTMHYGDGNVDMAFVMPTLRMTNLMAFDMSSLMGPPELMYILGQPFEVPSNIFIPQQWETFVEIIKDHYYLYLAPGDYTLAALSGRVPLDVLLSGGDLTSLLAAMSWREIDIRDVAVTGDTNDADLTVDPDLVNTVTMNLANVPPGSTTLCFSAGDLENQAGLGRLVPLGIKAFDCAGGGNPCSGAVTLTTTAASGEFAGMGYLAAAMVDLTDTDDALVLLDRGPHTQTYTTTLSSFFRLLEPAYDGGVFSWNDAANPGAGSPPVHLQMARLGSLDSTEVYWEVMIDGGNLAFGLPALPPEAPPAPLAGVTYLWDQVSIGLGFALPSFDYNAFAFSDVAAHMTHAAVDGLAITLLYDPQGAGEGRDLAASSIRLDAGTPNPFRDATRLRFGLARPAPVDLAIYGVDGRRIVTLLAGERVRGTHDVVWQGRDAEGRGLPSGAYWARLSTRGASRTRMVILQR